MSKAAEALSAIAAAYADPDAVARRLAGDGTRIIRTIGLDAPFTMLRAAGFVPVRVQLIAGDTPRADALLGPATGRRRGHRLLEWMLDPEQAQTPILITRADEQQAHLFAVVRELKRLNEPGPRNVHCLDLLHQPRASSHRYNRARINRLNHWLGELGGSRVDDEQIAQAAAADRIVQSKLLSLQELRVNGHLSGSDMLHCIGAAAILPPETLVPLLDQLLDDTASFLLRSGERVWLTGSALEDDTCYTAIEADGAVIIGDTHDWGSARLNNPPPEALDAVSDPLRQVPLAASHMADLAARCVAEARAADAARILLVASDHDQSALWLLPALRAQAGDLPVKVRVDPAPKSKPATPAKKSGSPAPAPQRSRKLLSVAGDFGTYQRQWFSDIREQVAAGAPFAIVNANAPQEILRALGIPFVVNQWWASIVAAKRQSRRYSELLKAHDYPARIEAYSTQALAAAFDDSDEAPWGGVPSPDFVHAVLSTDPTLPIFEAMAKEHDASAYLYERTTDPRDTIETRWWEVMPDHWDEALEEERIDLLTAELRDAIAQLETATGRSFDPERFVEVMNLVNEQEQYYRETRDLIARTVPAPISVVDQMPATMVPQWHRGTEWARDAAKAFRDEVATRVADGKGAVADERVRLAWVGRGLWSDTAFYQKWEQSHGAVFVCSMYLSLAADGYIRHFDEGRDPMRALAARFLTMGDELRMPSWAGPWHVAEAQRHQVDGAVAIDDADPFVIRALEDAGVPVLRLSLDNFANDADEIDALHDRVTRFIEGEAGEMAARRRGAAS